VRYQRLLLKIAEKNGYYFTGGGAIPEKVLEGLSFSW
jgi:hypothetical protein